VQFSEKKFLDFSAKGFEKWFIFVRIHISVSTTDLALSQMSSAVRAVLAGLEIQNATVFASDLNDLCDGLSMSRRGVGFLLKASHRSDHHEHYSNQHYEERYADGEEICGIEDDDQD
jgi:hypothetical protein